MTTKMRISRAQAIAALLLGLAVGLYILLWEVLRLRSILIPVVALGVILVAVAVFIAGLRRRDRAENDSLSPGRTMVVFGLFFVPYAIAAIIGTALRGSAYIGYALFGIAASALCIASPRLIKKRD